MRLDQIFEKQVDRPIEGVIKADDDASLFLEVEEYVLTNEVEARLGSFLDAYNNYEGANGVWISGFFGSGKSHLLKILSLLLENRLLDDTPVLDLFLPKCRDNEILRGDLKRAASIPSKSILFNIDQKAEIISKSQVDALLSVFAKVFDEMCGYFGKQGYIAQFERDLDNRDLYGSFRDKYQEIAGKPWERGREEALFESANIAKAYTAVTGNGNDSGKGILDKYRADYSLSIEDFANQINSYIEKQEPNFRLNFFVDEVGQYIADNTKLMTNLQTVAESLATKCRGRAWVVVTAQEDMNAVVGEMGKQQGNDFSKIQARFANKMKLTSKDVAEVIQKRLLLKNDLGVPELSDIYHEQANNFKTLFDFTDGSVQYRNYVDKEHFIHAYPFIPYQFDLFQAAIQNLSDHNAFEGKHSSVGERSMLGVFQQVAIHIKDHEIRELATFDLMFEGIRSALKAQIQGAVLLAEKNLQDAFAVRVLKSLFLVKYVKQFKATVRNISILMMDNFDRNVTDLQTQVAAALDLLEQQTYIQRNGDLYEFLTNEEKDIEEEIKNTDVDTSEVTKELERIIFDRVLKQRKVRYEDSGQDYSFSRKLDGVLCGRESELSINVITPLNEHADNETTLSMQSMGKAELLVIMPSDNRFFQDLFLYKKTDSYIRINMTQAQQETIKRILSDKQVQNQERLSELETKAKTLLGQARLIMNLKALEIGSSDAQSRIFEGFSDLIRTTYPHLAMLRGITYSENDLGLYLRPPNTIVDMPSEAEQEILGYVQGNRQGGVRTTLKKLVEHFEKKPYGWSLAAILCNCSRLWAREKIEVREDSNPLEDNALEKALRNTKAYANLIVNPQVVYTALQLRKLKEFYEEYFDTPAGNIEARQLARDTRDKLQEKLQQLEGIGARVTDYPFLGVLSDPIQQLREITGNEHGYFLTDFASVSESLLDVKEETLDPVIKFMSGPSKTIYEESRRFLEEQNANFTEMEGDGHVKAREILADPECYKGNRMQQLKSLVDGLRSDLDALVKIEKETALEMLHLLRDEFTGMEDFSELDEDTQKELLQAFTAFERDLETQKIVAVIRQRITGFRESNYLHLLTRKDECLRKKNKPYKKEKGGNGGGSDTEERKTEYISKSSVKVDFRKTLLEDESDVDAYAEAVKEAYLAEVKKGKKVRV